MFASGSQPTPRAPGPIVGGAPPPRIGLDAFGDIKEEGAAAKSRTQQGALAGITGELPQAPQGPPIIKLETVTGEDGEKIQVLTEDDQFKRIVDTEEGNDTTLAPIEGFPDHFMTANGRIVRGVTNEDGSKALISVSTITPEQRENPQKAANDIMNSTLAATGETVAEYAERTRDDFGNPKAGFFVRDAKLNQEGEAALAKVKALRSGQSLGVPEFNSVEEVDAAGLPAGTKVKVNGRPGTVTAPNE